MECTSLLWVVPGRWVRHPWPASGMSGRSPVAWPGYSVAKEGLGVGCLWSHASSGEGVAKAGSNSVFPPFSCPGGDPDPYPSQGSTERWGQGLGPIQYGMSPRRLRFGQSQGPGGQACSRNTHSPGPKLFIQGPQSPRPRRRRLPTLMWGQLQLFLGLRGGIGWCLLEGVTEAQLEAVH